MAELATTDLVLLHLADLPADSADRTTAGIGTALGIGDTVAGRVELVTALADLRDGGLVTESRSGNGEAGGDAVYRLTDAGRTAVADLEANLDGDTIVVDRGGDREEVSLGAIESAVPELSRVEAMARISDGVLRVPDAETGSFVDRKEPLGTFEDLLDAVADGSAETALVTGERGMGKTALVEEVFDRARERSFRTLTGSARDGAGEPYGAIRAALSAHRESAPERLFEGTEATDEANLDERRRSFFFDVATFLGDLAADRPLALFVNDLEHADPATRALLEYLSTTLADERVLLVGAVRPGAVGGNRPLADGDGVLEGATRIDLEGFDRAATATFLEGALGDAGVPGAFVDALHERTGGNPLFLEASASYMAESGVVDPRTGYYPEEPDDLPVPDRVQTLVTERIAGLPSPVRDVLDWASVVGESVPRPVLEAVTPDDDFDEALDQLAAVGVLTPAEDGTLRFTNDLVHEVVHDGIDVEERRWRHERVAEALETVHDGDLDAHAAAIAAHFRRAGATDRAIEYFERAGDHAAGVYAYETAVDAYESALELARETDDGESVRRLLEEIGRVHFLSDDYDEAERVFEYVAERTDDPAVRRRVATFRTELHNDRGEFDEALAIVEESLADWDGETASRDVCSLLVHRAWANNQTGEVDAARRLTERARSMAADIGAADLRARALRTAGVVEYHYGDLDEAAATYEEAAAVAEAAGDRRGLAACQNNLGGARQLQGDLDAAVESLRQARDRWHELGNRAGEAVPLANLGYLQMKRGRFEEAREKLEDAVDLSRRLGLDDNLAYQWMFLGELYINAGDLERARAYLERGLERGEEISLSRAVHQSHANLSRVSRLEDDPDAAMEHVERAMDLVEPTEIDVISDARFREGQIRREQGDLEGAIEVHEAMLERAADVNNWVAPVKQRIGLAAALVEVDRSAEAIERAEQALETAETTGNALIPIAAKSALARARHVAGKSEAAEDLLREALADAEAIGSESYACQTRVRLGSVLGDRGEVEDGREHLTAAIETAKPNGARRFVRQARETLDDLD